MPINLNAFFFFLQNINLKKKQEEKMLSLHAGDVNKK